MKTRIPKLTLPQAKVIISRQQGELVKATLDNRRAHREHDALIAQLTTLYPSHLSPRARSKASLDEPFNWAVCVHSPTGQLAWLIPDDTLPLFAHLERRASDWDGHTKLERYERLHRLAEQRAEGK